MSKLTKKRALEILRRHWKRSFFQAANVREYIAAVRQRLIACGVPEKDVPKTPVRFLRFCRTLGLYPRKARKGTNGNAKKG